VGALMGLFKLPFWEICLAVAGIMLVISGPGMVIAWLKLRQRNMGPILDANGWAINGRVKMNVPFGGSLTSVAQLPPGSLPAAADPFGEKRSPWPGVLKFVVIVCFVFSVANQLGLVHKAIHAAGLDAYEPSLVRNLDKERDELAALIKKFDVDKDGKVTRAEFTGTDDAFAAADTDGDKEITSADLK
ncbi:MAG: EF-hand domain-containing protein, partial [Planctomycetes bacterium]|nr:EF-hand domain-containing protein [Planctomycetota bacterium]